MFNRVLISCLTKGRRSDLGVIATLGFLMVSWVSGTQTSASLSRAEDGVKEASFTVKDSTPIVDNASLHHQCYVLGPSLSKEKRWSEHY